MKLALLLPLLALMTGCSSPPAAHRAPKLNGVEVVQLASGLGFTEGPVWISEEQALVFSDIPASQLLRWSDADGLGVLRESLNPNGNLLDLDGRLLTCRHGARDLVRTEGDGTLTVLATHYEGRRLNSPNDVAVDAGGALWFTDPPWGLSDWEAERELGGHWVFRLEPETGQVERVLDGTIMPNGIAFSPDGEVLYVADTGGNRRLPEALRTVPATLTAYRVVEGVRLDPEPLWRVETTCDGMAIDEYGNIYATGRTLTVWSPSGEPLGELVVPEQPANCCFGGPDGRTLFITARTGLYAAELDVRGHRVTPAGR